MNQFELLSVTNVHGECDPYINNLRLVVEHMCEYSKVDVEQQDVF